MWPASRPSPPRSPPRPASPNATPTNPRSDPSRPTTATRSWASTSDMSIDTRVRVARAELPNPVVAASGTFGHGAEVAGLCDPPQLGAVTAKSQAPFAWAGNPPPRLHPTAASLVKSVGLQGPGLDHWVAHDLPPLRAPGARAISSLRGHTIDDFERGADTLRPVTGELVAVEINVSCPNLAHDGQPFAYDAKHTAAAVHAVAAAHLDVTLL